MPQLSTFHSQLSAFPAALPYNPNLSVWLSVDPLSDKYPGVSPYVYCADNPVRLVDVDGREISPPPPYLILKQGFVMGVAFALKYMYQARHSTMTVSNTVQAVIHYYLGGGNRVNLNAKFSVMLMNTLQFKNMHQKIISGKNIDAHGNVRTSGSFSVDMTNEEDAFFIGRTGVNYVVTTSDDKRKCTVTYTLFMKGNVPDDFSDPNFIMEQNTNDKNSRMRIGGDGIGPQLELGGDPYKFKSQRRSFTFDNPGTYE